MPGRRTHTIVSLCALLLAGCGANVPRIAEPWEKDMPGSMDGPNGPIIPITASGQIEFEVKKSIYCQLRYAVAQADLYRNTGKFAKGNYDNKLLPNEWGVQVALSFQVDENAAVNPGVTLNTPLPTAQSNFADAASVLTPQSRAVGLGATLSSTASRTDKFNSFFDVAYLRGGDAIRTICDPAAKDALSDDPSFPPAKSSFLVDELGITGWLLDALFVEEAIPSSNSTHVTKPMKAPRKRSGAGLGQGATKIDNGQDAISIEIKFVIVSSGNVTPSWKLVRVSANTGSSPFFGVGRTRTHDLIITIGPKSTQTDFANLALQIGQAVSGGNRSSATMQ